MGLLVVLSPAAGGEPLVLPAPPDLRWVTSIPGGFKDLSCTVTFPPGSATPDALAAYSHVRVVDPDAGVTAWFGRLTDPGLQVDAAGQAYSLTAEGAQIDADGWREVYGLVDRAQESWQAVGDFSPAQASIVGDLFPGDLNFEWDPANLDLDFPGWDDFPGFDYPPGADYPGYLGNIGDPFVGVGGSSPIPGTGGDVRLGGDLGFLPGWVPGITGSVAGAETGNGATVTVSGGWARFTSGTITNGATARRNLGTSVMSVVGPSVFDGNGFYLGNLYTIGTVIARFQLVDAQASALVWMHADPTLSDSGFMLQITTTALTWYQVDAGTATSVASTAQTTSVATDYEVRAGLLGPAAVVPAGTITPGSAEDIDWSLTYNHVDWSGGSYDTGLLAAWMATSTTRWAGLGVVGDATTTSRAVDFKGWVVRRFNPFDVE